MSVAQPPWLVAVSSSLMTLLPGVKEGSVVPPSSLDVLPPLPPPLLLPQAVRTQMRAM
jgi:hypothetical protein